MNNSMEMIKTIMSNKNPQQVIQNMIGNNTNPMLNNLINMAQNGDTKGVENFARNIFKEKGRDFDKEFSDFIINIIFIIYTT